MPTPAFKSPPLPHVVVLSLTQSTGTVLFPEYNSHRFFLDPQKTCLELPMLCAGEMGMLKDNKPVPPVVGCIPSIKEEGWSTTGAISSAPSCACWALCFDSQVGQRRLDTVVPATIFTHLLRCLCLLYKEVGSVTLSHANCRRVLQTALFTLQHIRLPLFNTKMHSSIVTTFDKDAIKLTTTSLYSTSMADNQECVSMRLPLAGPGIVVEKYDAWACPLMILFVLEESPWRIPFGLSAFSLWDSWFSRIHGQKEEDSNYCGRFMVVTWCKEQRRHDFGWAVCRIFNRRICLLRKDLTVQIQPERRKSSQKCCRPGISNQEALSGLLKVGKGLLLPVKELVSGTFVSAEMRFGNRIFATLLL
ncbi:hypothetical protein BJ508DRAFT_345071 [Ascobolus immersus RN42]|uniref:Uncharacterized protein n=1 Tax=Ascobolus immersus RN42 TaxID=1160509 RepID=A0A3N4ISP9_ASCIM|nr:hypothetical protein BJ508DRAFT_345071 [Ascobolus immersus RN42]